MIVYTVFRNIILIEHTVCCSVQLSVVYTSGIENCLEIGKDHKFNIQLQGSTFL